MVRATMGNRYQSLMPMIWFMRPIALGSVGCRGGVGITASMYRRIACVSNCASNSLCAWAPTELVQTLDDLHGWKVSVLAQTGLSFDLSTAVGKFMRTIMAGLAEFERDLIRDRVKSGL